MGRSCMYALLHARMSSSLHTSQQSGHAAHTLQPSVLATTLLFAQEPIAPAIYGHLRLLCLCACILLMPCALTTSDAVVYISFHIPGKRL